MSNILSEDILVYPTTHRGTTTNNNNETTPYNPTARLATEFNLTSLAAYIPDFNNFIVKVPENGDDNVILFIKGYIIRINNASSYFTGSSSIYAILNVKDRNITGYENMYEITPSGVISNYDLDPSGSFLGLTLSSSADASLPSLLVWDGTDYITSSRQKFKLSSINGGHSDDSADNYLKTKIVELTDSLLVQSTVSSSPYFQFYINGDGSSTPKYLKSYAPNVELSFDNIVLDNNTMTINTGDIEVNGDDLTWYVNGFFVSMDDTLRLSLYPTYTSLAYDSNNYFKINSSTIDIVRANTSIQLTNMGIIEKIPSNGTKDLITDVNDSPVFLQQTSYADNKVQLRLKKESTMSNVLTEYDLVTDDNFEDVDTKPVAASQTNHIWNFVKDMERVVTNYATMGSTTISITFRYNSVGSRLENNVTQSYGLNINIADNTYLESLVSICNKSLQVNDAIKSVQFLVNIDNTNYNVFKLLRRESVTETGEYNRYISTFYFVSNDKVILLTKDEDEASSTTFRIKYYSNYIQFGNLTVNGSVTCQSVNVTSDLRLKENVENFNYNKSILDVPVKTYDYINGDKNQIGFIAQDLQKVYPELVTKNEDGYLSIKETKLVYLLLEEIKSLRKEVDDLKSKK